MITDLRDDLYNAILRSSAAFFTKHTTGTLLSTIVNDIEKVQFAMSSVLAEFLQQFFTFVFTAAVVVLLGGKLAWVLLIVCARDFVLFEKNRPASTQHNPWRTGQAGGNPEHSARNNYRQSHRQGVWHGALGDGTLPRRRPTAVPGKSAVWWRRSPSALR